MKENERQKFIIKSIAKSIRKITNVEELVYTFEIEDSDMLLLLKTKKSYESEYDRLFEQYKHISAVVEYVNEKRKNVVISKIKYLRKESLNDKKIV